MEVTDAMKKSTIILVTVLLLFLLLLNSAYTVEELTGWSWRYTASEPQYANQEKKIVADATQNVVTLTNTPKADQWLHDESYVINDFGSGSKDESNNN